METCGGVVVVVVVGAEFRDAPGTWTRGMAARVISESSSVHTIQSAVKSPARPYVQAVKPN